MITLNKKKSDRFPFFILKISIFGDFERTRVKLSKGTNLRHVLSSLIKFCGILMSEIVNQ